jgi:hypothetical protein
MYAFDEAEVNTINDESEQEAFESIVTEVTTSEEIVY